MWGSTSDGILPPGPTNLIAACSDHGTSRGTAEYWLVKAVARTFQNPVDILRISAFFRSRIARGRASRFLADLDDVAILDLRSISGARVGILDTICGPDKMNPCRGVLPNNRSVRWLSASISGALTHRIFV